MPNSDKNIGVGKTVAFAGYTITGAAAGNYHLSQPENSTADITPASLTVSGITAADKPYDGSTGATLAGVGSASLDGVVSGDAVTLTGTASGAFATAAPASGIAVQVSGLSLSGADIGNYTLTQPSTTATITPAVPVLTWDSPADITYGTELGSAQLDATASVSGSFVYTPAAGTQLGAGGGQTLSVTFTPTDMTDYVTVTQTVSINVNLATPTVSVTDNGGPYTGSAYAATTTVAGWGGVPASSLEGVAPTLVYYAGDGSPLAAAPSTGGTYTVVASFASSADYASVSVSQTFTISAVATTTTFVSVAPNPASVYNTITLTASVGFATSATGMPTGTVTFYDGSTAIATGAVDALGVAVATTSFSAAGTYALKAHYDGDENGNGSISAEIELTVKNNE